MSAPRLQHAFATLFLIGMLAAALRIGLAQTSPPPPDELIVTEEDNGKTVTAVVDQTIAVNLRGNPTTGFQWLLTAAAGDSVVDTGPVIYTPDPGGGVGAGGTFSFPFRAVSPGQTSLAFDYRQPWDPASSAELFVVTIDVSTGDMLPRLTIELVNGSVVIRWPMANSTGFFLEGATRLQPPDWAALNVLPLPEGDRFSVTLSTTGNMLLFRLRK